jgi:hypothetical protein
MDLARASLLQEPDGALLAAVCSFISSTLAANLSRLSAFNSTMISFLSAMIFLSKSFSISAIVAIAAIGTGSLGSDCSDTNLSRAIWEPNLL